MNWMSELSARAGEMLPEAVAEYFRHGAGNEIAAREAAAAWDALRLRPRILRDVSSCSTATTVLSSPVATPILVAPTTLQRHADSAGELATARGAASAGSLICLSSNSGTSFEAVGQAGAPWWLQIYVLRDRGLTVHLIQTAVAHGARALVLTADTPVVGNKRGPGTAVWDLTPESFLLANIEREGVAPEALEKADDLGPECIGWLNQVGGVPVVVKGVLRGDDARLCVSAGAAAVWVSNHGGRQLDRAVSTARALPEVVSALSGSSAEVYVDGGLRSGEHVLAALALGANAVFVGRPALWGLAAGGAEGVSQLLTTLTAELAGAMRLCGASSCSDLGADLVEPAGTRWSAPAAMP
jgi:4-hydroxymandelate oxidase